MRSRPEPGRRRKLAAGGALLAAACLWAGSAWPAEDARPHEFEVREALERVSEDPALAREKTIRTLEWVGDDAAPRAQPGWMSWIGGLFDWLAQASRLLVWLLIAALVGLLLYHIARLAGGARRGTRAGNTAVPTHVHDLDIRPESLPDDVGAAAWALWEGGSQREALALLYRGLLSRLVHVHEVPIRDSSTEGDSLRLAERHLPPARHGYVGALIRTWQRAVYGGRAPQAPEVRVLCEQFAAALVPEQPLSGAAP